MVSYAVPLVDRRLRVAAALVVAAVVLAASVVDPPGTGAPTQVFGLPADKWLHAAAYAGVAAAVGYAALDGSGLSARALVAVFCLAAGYGLAVELVQLPLAARTFDPADAAANAVGALVGTLPWLVVDSR